MSRYECTKCGLTPSEGPEKTGDDSSHIYDDGQEQR